MIRAGLALNDEGSSNAQMIIPVSSFLRTSTPLRLGPFVTFWARTQDSAPGVFRSLQPTSLCARHSLPPGRARFYQLQSISLPDARNKVRSHSHPDASRTI